MKQKSQVAMRMEFLEYGDRLGFPKLGYGLGKRVKEGEGAWTAFASRARLSELAPALRNARIRADYYAQKVEVATATQANEEEAKHQRMLDNLAKARAARAAKRAEGVA